ncbi:MAG: hypothetical protein ACM3ZQ_06760 [Bacillota bacterium]
MMPDFFSRLKEGVAKGVTTVSVKSKEVMETTKVKTQINSLQDQVKGQQAELGQAVMPLILDGTIADEALLARCQAIQALEEQIQGLEAQLEQIRAQSEQALGSIQPHTPAQPQYQTQQYTAQPQGQYQPTAPVAAPTYAAPSFPSAPANQAPTPIPVMTMSYHQPAAQPAATVTCECGAVNRAGDRFCNNCGKRLQE